MAITQKMIDAQNSNIPPLYGPSDFGRMIGWDRSKIATYSTRGVLPEPAAYIGGKRPVWTELQILKFAHDNGIEIK